MFSEAAHHDEFYLQALSKGSSRLVYETQENSENPIYIVPVGINYGHHRNPFCDLHLVFGEGILIQPFIGTTAEKPERLNAIKTRLRTEMEKCFHLVQTYKPAASKSKSGEIYLFGEKPL